MNIVALIGTIVEQPTLKEFDSGVKGTFITLRVAKPFRSMDGSYESDFIRCVLWEGIAQNTCEYCMKGDTIGIRGRVASRNEEIIFNCDKDEHKKKFVTNQIIVERVTFISTAKKNKQLPQEDQLDDYVSDF